MRYSLNPKLSGAFCGRLSVGHLRQTHFHFPSHSLTHTHSQFGHLFHWLWLDSSRTQCSTCSKGAFKSNRQHRTVLAAEKRQIFGANIASQGTVAFNRLCCNTTTNTHTLSAHCTVCIHRRTHNIAMQFGRFLPFQKQSKQLLVQRASVHCFPTLIYLFQSLPLLAKLAELEFEHLKCAPNKRMYWQIINLQQIVSMRAAHTSFSRSLICALQQLKSNKLNGVKYLPVWMSSTLKH